MPQPLSSKESSLFRQVVKNFEAKQYKKGLKAAEQILRKSPNHGDTQAMKALILNAQGQSDDAFALAKTALRNDMRSHVCWHVYGLLYRSVKNFEEAMKAYKFALKLEPDSVQIQRDLALLQVHMRDYPGYLQSRRAMLQARPQLRLNWTALAVAHHLAGQLAAAEEVLTTYENTLKTPPPPTDLEHSEAVLYRNCIIAEAGETERALDHVETVYKSSLDRGAALELRAKYLLQLDRKKEAERAYRALIDRNPEYRPHYEGVEKAVGLDRSEKSSHEQLYQIYKNFTDNGSDRSDAARRIPLEFLEGDQFRKAADDYLRRMLTKGVPSTFANVKALYTEDEKRKVMESLVEGYVNEESPNGDVNNDNAKEAAQKFKYSALFFLAQHYSYHRCRQLDKATSYIEQAIEGSPSSVDYQMTKARILKHHGDTEKAAKSMNHAREQDERDRYINSKCAKYQLRNNENDKALQIMSKFTRNETTGGALGDLQDMQCIWFLTEDGEAYLRQGKLGLALKRFTTISDVFDTWQEDQFDFHSFSLRKGQIRAYVDMIRWQDRLREHPFYSRAAISAIRIYILLHDRPHLAQQTLTNGVGAGPGTDNLSSAERKKAQKKAKKEHERQEKAEASKREAEKKSASNAAKKPAAVADGETKKEDPDPVGVKLCQTEQPLQVAMKFLGPLLELSSQKIEAQNVGFELYMRRKRYLLALKCLLAAKNIDGDDPTLHEQIIRFQHIISGLSEPLAEKVSTVISQSTSDENNSLPPTSSLAIYNSDYLTAHAQSAKHIHAALRGRAFLDPDSKDENEKRLLETLALDEAVSAGSEGISAGTAIEGLALLDEWKSGQTTRRQYIQRARDRWKQTTVFQRELASLEE